MITKLIVDTGPLVAFFNPNDHHHSWTKQQLSEAMPPLLTCEAVLTETCFLLRKTQNPIQAKAALLELLNRNLITIPFHINDEVRALHKLIKSYNKIPMSLADACLVRMSEQLSNTTVMTIDQDFHIYRRHGRQTIPTLMPR